jgi:hypothetical protein
MSQIGICTEHATKLNDYTPKPVLQCPLCQRYVCSLHFEAKLAYIPDLGRADKIAKETREIVDEQSIGGGHPCLPYTTEFWKRFELEKILTMQRRKNNMDGFGYFSDEEITTLSTKRKYTSEEGKPPKPNNSKEPNEETKPSRWQKLKEFLK